jgi:hypothetical protein
MQIVPWGLSNTARKRDWIVQKSAGEEANFRAVVNEKTRFGRVQTMKFLGSADKIHSA